MVEHFGGWQAVGGEPGAAVGPGSAPSARRRVALALLVALLLLAAPAAALGQAPPAPSITIGESNDPAQTAELLAVFGAAADAPFTTVTVAETTATTGAFFDLSGVDTAYSSTALACRPAGSGLDVATRNIELATPALYAMALVTAGVEDASLVVAAPDDAPALGMTALAGVFAGWEAAPCRGEPLSPQRRDLAFEQIAVAAAVAGASADPARVDAAARLLLDTQQAVVTGRLTEPAAIAAIVDREAAAGGLDLAAAERTALIDLMTRLGRADLDWRTYAQGWTIAGADPDRIALRGRGDRVGGRPRVDTGAVGGGRLPRAATPAATPAARPTGPAATPAAVASPIATPSPPAVPATPLAAAEPPLRPVAGTILGVAAGGVTVAEEGGGRHAYALAAGAPVRRAGEPAALAAVAPNDRVWILVDDRRGRAVALDAEPPAASVRSPSGWGWLLPLLAVLAAALLFTRRRVFPVRPPAAAATTRRLGVAVGGVRRRWSSRPVPGGGRRWRFWERRASA